MLLSSGLLCPSSSSVCLPLPWPQISTSDLIVTHGGEWASWLMVPLGSLQPLWMGWLSFPHPPAACPAVCRHRLPRTPLDTTFFYYPHSYIEHGCPSVLPWKINMPFPGPNSDSKLAFFTSVPADVFRGQDSIVLLWDSRLYSKLISSFSESLLMG